MGFRNRISTAGGVAAAMLGPGRVLASDSKLSRNYVFEIISVHGPKKRSLRPLRRVALRLWSCGAWAYYDSPSESLKREIDAKFPPE